MRGGDSLMPPIQQDTGHDTVEVDLDGQLVPVPEGGLFDRYRMDTDLAVDATSGALLTKRLTSGRPVALLCHAPAAALAASNPDGSWPFRGYKMTGLSNAEERLNPFAWKAKWLLEDRLKEAGADYTAGCH
jgi:putative intracellular protease/amidase